MSKSNQDKTYQFSKGFQSIDDEIEHSELKVDGHFPEWLNGSLIRTGPGLFELEHQNYKHWFDGLALLHKFQINNGEVTYRNKFLKSDSYVLGKKNGKISIKEFATDPCQNLFQKVKSFFVPPRPTDNGNINIITYHDQLLATTETPLPIIFDKSTLKTIEHFDYKDDLAGQIESAHPLYDKDGFIYNCLLKMGAMSFYQVYKMDPQNCKREVIAKIPRIEPSYMHSIGMSQNFIILAEFPYLINPYELMFAGKPLIENYHWKPEKGTNYIIINKKTGKRTSFKSESVFGFHHVNAFEQENQLMIDFVGFNDPTIIEALYLKDVQKGKPIQAAGYLMRTCIDLKDKKISTFKLADKLIELPRINDKNFTAKPYRFVYGAGNTEAGNYLDDITKIDIDAGTSIKWYELGCYPSEPVFIQDPESKTEDDGILLSVVLDTNNENTFLLALNTKDLKEIARATVQKIIPFSYHGQFIN